MKFALAPIVAAVLSAFFCPQITEVKTTVPPAAIEMDGALPNQGGLVGLFNNLKSFSAPVFGNWDLTEISAGLSADTYTAGAVLGGFIRRTSNGTTQDSLPTAASIVSAIPGAVVGQSFALFISNMGSGTLTIAGNTGVTLQGTATLSRFSTRLFAGTVTGSAAVTIENCFTFSAPAANG